MYWACRKVCTKPGRVLSIIELQQLAIWPAHGYMYMTPSMPQLYMQPVIPSKQESRVPRTGLTLDTEWQQCVTRKVMIRTWTRRYLAAKAELAGIEAQVLSVAQAQDQDTISISGVSLSTDLTAQLEHVNLFI